MSTTLSPEALSSLIDRLTDHVTSEVSSIDMEQRFRDLLDELYDFKAIGGPFAFMQPSAVLEEMDPTAFRCGVADMDTSVFIEIRGEFYDPPFVETAREEFIDELRSELRDAKQELAEHEAQEGGEDSDADSITELRATVERLTLEVDAATDHAF